MGRGLVVVSRPVVVSRLAVVGRLAVVSRLALRWAAKQPLGSSVNPSGDKPHSPQQTRSHIF